MGRFSAKCKAGLWLMGALAILLALPGLASDDWEEQVKQSVNNARQSANRRGLAQALARRAKVYERHGRPDSALADWNEAVQLNPREYLIERAQLHERQGRLDAALADLAESIRAKPEALAHFYRAGLYEKQKNADLATADWNEAVRLSPRVYIDLRAQFYERQRKPELALADWMEAVRLDPEGHMIDRAKFYDRQGKRDLALADFNYAIGMKAGDSTYCDRARFFERAGQADLALADWTAAVRLNPKLRLVDRAQFYESQGKPDLALADWNEAVRLDPGGHLVERAQFLERAAKPSLALADLNQSVRLASLQDKQSALINRAEFNERQGKPKLALADFNEAVRVAPANTRHVVLAHRAQFFQRQGKPELAAAGFNEAVRSAPLGGKQTALLDRASYYTRLGRLDLALADCEAGLKLEGKNLDLLLLKGKLLKGKGEKLLSAAAFREAIARTPKDCADKSKIAEAYLELGLPDLALVNLDAAVDECGKSAQRCLMRGQILDKLGHHLKAREDLDEAIRLSQQSLTFDDRGIAPRAKIALQAVSASPRDVEVLDDPPAMMTSPVSAINNYALLFASDTYVDTGFSPLKNPIADATAIAQTLKDDYKWNVRVIENPTRTQVRGVLYDYAARTYADKDELFIFIAGHGLYDQVSKMAYLVTHDSLKNDQGRDTCISSSDLIGLIDRIDCRHILVSLDVCHSGAFDEYFARTFVGANRDGDAYPKLNIQEMLTRAGAWRTRKMITSSGIEAVSDGVPGQHSPFAWHLLEALRSLGGTDGYLNFGDIIKAVQRITPGPRAVNFGADDPGSDFFFIPSRSL